MTYVNLINASEYILPPFKETSTFFHTGQSCHQVDFNLPYKIKRLSTTPIDLSEGVPLFKRAIEVKKALLNGNVEGVILIQDQKNLEATSFYLSLIADPEHKPIILTTFNEHIWKDVQRAMEVISDAKLTSNFPIIIYDGLIYKTCYTYRSRMKDLKSHFSKSKVIGSMRKGQMILCRHHFHYTPPDRMLPMIPESVALIQLRNNFQKKELETMSFTYKGIVIECNDRGRKQEKLKALIRTFKQKGLPVIVTDRAPLKSGKQIIRGVPAGVLYAGFLPGSYAQVLLGMMLAHQYRWEKMERIIDFCKKESLKYDKSID